MPVDGAIEDEINRRYANKVVLDLGLCICLWDIVSRGDIKVNPDSGTYFSTVEFNYVVFRPFIGEVMTGKIRNMSHHGIRVSLRFFDDVWIPTKHLQDPSTFSKEEQLWIWQWENHSLYMDMEEVIRFRVTGVSFHDIHPAIDQGEHALSGGSESEGDPVHEKASIRRAPMVVTGAINEPGLGCLSWWQEDEEE
eukprot:Clim_evm24s191 gene=Clim_evmTU24s191